MGNTKPKVVRSPEKGDIYLGILPGVLSNEERQAIERSLKERITTVSSSVVLANVWLFMGIHRARTFTAFITISKLWERDGTFPACGTRLCLSRR